MKISIIGTGYVGLVSGVCLAHKGHQVICVDVDPEKVAKISQGVSPIYEKGLENLLEKHTQTNLIASTDLKKAVLDSEVSLIAVGTPFDGSEIDLTYIKQVSQQIGNVLKEKPSYHLVVVKSTVVPGTTDTVVLPILEQASGKKAGVDFGVGMNPEFLREGEAVEDFLNPDRIVVGGMDPKSQSLLEQVYEGFPGVPVLKTTNSTAEMIKYTSNCLLSTLISFSNEIGNLCASMGNVDVLEVMKGVHLDKRLSPILPDGQRVVPVLNTYLEAGCGFGGSCFPKDVKAIIAHGIKIGQPMELLQAVIQVNARQPMEMIALLNKHFAILQGVKIGVLGLAFKPGTDDMRESPAIPIVQHLLELGAKVKAYDPVARQEAEKCFADTEIIFCDGLTQALEDVEVILVLTRWSEFSEVQRLIKEKTPQPLLVDGRRMFDKHKIEKYEGIGL
jgi:UDPglucose 6-dehydrogenase/GDP-mannose 6-dehydrogenase